MTRYTVRYNVKWQIETLHLDSCEFSKSLGSGDPDTLYTLEARDIADAKLKLFERPEDDFRARTAESCAVCKPK
jgi:hypothetical protein